MNKWQWQLIYRATPAHFSGLEQPFMCMCIMYITHISITYMKCCVGMCIITVYQLPGIWRCVFDKKTTRECAIYMSNTDWWIIPCFFLCVVGSPWRAFFISTPMWWKAGRLDGLYLTQSQEDWSTLRWVVINELISGWRGWDIACVPGVEDTLTLTDLGN